MKKKYILNGKIYDEDSINEFAKKSSLSIDDYIKESGAKEHNDTGIYTLNGKDYDGNTMAEFAQKSNMGYDEYLKESGAKKKEISADGGQVGVSEIPSTENKISIPGSPQKIKPISDFDAIRQRDNETFNPRNINTPAVSDMTQMDKPFTSIDKEEIVKGKAVQEKNINDAIDNTTDRRLKSKGINAPKGSALFNQERAKTQKAYDYGVVKYHKYTDPKTGEETAGLDRSVGWYEGLTKGWNEAVNGNEEADAFVNMTNKERVDFLKEKHLDQPQPFGLMGEQYDAAGSVGNLLGSAGPTTVKAAAGAVAGTGLAALAPETGGISLAGLPTVMAYAFTALDMIKHGMKDETIRRYQEIKSQHPEMNDEEAMAHAAQGGIPVGGIVGAGENAILMGEGLKSPFSAESKTVLGGALKRSGKAALKFGTTTGVGTAAEQAEGNAEGIKTKPQEIFNNSVNSAMDNAGYGFALHALMSEIPQIPKMVKSAAKYTLVNDGKLPEVQQALQNAASEGKIPEVKANEVVSDLQNYKMALDKTSDGLTPEAKASVAGLIQAKGNLLEEMKTKDDSQHDVYKKKVEAIDQQIKDITATNKPYQHEVDDISGQPLEKPSFDDIAKKRVDDLADKISKGKTVEDVVDVKTEQNFPEELEKSLNRIQKEERSKNKDKEDAVNELSDNIEKYRNQRDKEKITQPVELNSKGETDFSKTNLTNEKPQTTEENKIPVPETESGSTNEPPPETIPTASEGEEAKTTGVRHETLKKVADRLGLKPPERGTFLSPEDQTKRGRLLLQGGVDPLQVAADFKESGKATADEVSVARAHFENLTKEAQSALDKYGKNSPEFAKAKLEMQKWQDEVQKPMATSAGATFSAHQGENDLDTGSYVATSNALENKQGKPLNAEQEKTIKDLTGKVKTLTEHSQNLEKQLIEATDKEKGTTKKENFESKARRIADKIMKSETPSWLKINDPSIKKQGIGEAEVKKLLADATINMGKLLDKGIEYSKAVKEAVEDIVKHFGEDRRDEIEKGFAQHFKDNQEPTKEEKNIKRLEKELDDLRQNIAKQKSPKRELTDKEKQLQEQIKDERERMGLSASKMEKPLSELEQREADQKELSDLQNKFVDKKDNKFTVDDSKQIWNYANKNYLDKGVKYVDAIDRTAKDIGLSIRQVSEAITTKENKKQSDAVWKKQHEIRNGQAAVRQYIENQNKNVLTKIWRKITGVPRALKTALHGHIFAGTHYPMGLVTPSQWGIYFKGIGQMWKSAYGSLAKHEQAVRDLENDKNYVIAKKAGLENDPTHVGIDDYERSGKILGKLGDTGTRGFFGLKWTRQQIFNRYWDSLEPEDKTDGAAKSLAWLINNSTGATNLKVPAAIQEGLFSAGMESARWGRLIRNPSEAAARGTRILVDMAKGVKIKPEDKVFVKVWSHRVGQQLATISGLILLNAYTQSKTNPKNPVNFTDPSKPDYFKLKIGDVDVDLSGGTLGVKNLLVKSANYAIKDKSYKQEIGDVGGAGLQYLRGKLSPAYTDISELPLGTDYSGNILPFSSKKVPDGKRKIGWTEYLTSKVAPIFIQEVIKNIYEGAEENGIPKSTTEKVINGLIESGLSFGYGVHANPSSIDYLPAAGKDIKNYKEGGRAITPEEFKDYETKRDAAVQKNIDYLKKKGDVVIRNDEAELTPYDKLTDKEKTAAEKEAKEKATEEVKKDLFGEEPPDQEIKKEENQLKIEAKKLQLQTVE